MFWDRPDLTYKEDQRAFAGLADFVEWNTTGNITYLKNYNDRQQGQPTVNNCAPDQDNNVVCRYNLGSDNEVAIHGSDAFLHDSVTSNAGSHANTMSYIRIRNLTAEDPRTFLNTTQYDIVEVAANSPIRLYLRDFLQE